LTINDDAEKTEIATEQNKDSLNGFGSASITNSQDDIEEDSEDANECYRNQAIAEENYRYTPGATAIDNNKSTHTAISVADALRLHSGYRKVQGMITSLSRPYKMFTAEKTVCGNCGNTSVLKYDIPLSKLSPSNSTRECSNCKTETLHDGYEYVNAVTVELQDTDTFSEIECLSVLLFDDNTKNIHVGERVTIGGQIHIIQHNGKGKYLPYVYADSIQYESREEITLTQKDIEAIERFCKLNGSKIIERLVNLFAPSIIGHNHVKEGLLLSAVTTYDNDIAQLMRNRLHSILVGDPGLAKSALLREAIKLVLNSRYESGQHSSGKGLTAIVSKEDENYVLRLGPASLARGALCAINELGRIPYEEQAYLLDLMEEGKFTINNHGINARIKAPTTIIASANPINGSWKYDDKIDINEIPILKPLLDRFDLVFVFRKLKDIKDIRAYAYKKSELDNRKIPEYYNFLCRYIMYAKRFNPILSEEAKVMLNEYWIELATRNFGSPRIFDTLHRLAKARARLKLKKIVDTEDAREAMQFYNIILQQYEQIVSIPTSPREVAYNVCIDILKESDSTAISFEELIKFACGRNEQVKSYVDGKFKLQDNFKLRPLLDMLVNHSCIKQVKDKPVVLKWIKDAGTLDSTLLKMGEDVKEDSSSNRGVSDVSDAYDTKISPDNQHKSASSLNKNSESIPVATSHTSYTSDSNNKKKVEAFFYDNPSLPYNPLPPHSLEESPCYHIIGMNHKRRMYYCKLHPKESESIHLESVEHHCKYKEADVHKKEIIQKLSLIQKDNVTETEDKNKIIAQFVEENGIDDAIKELLSGI